ncbi:hypothetical protein Mgra_00002777 [Meloidogyne graminicola]|uniref:C3H1-type domain-containing protein n=1 Tax=Meloidogyne graminicola TaxID=189291 RepID=A0A8S9ZVR8_9BILA|nr:hypothetical protein Mgra_00002777 [Meloidogyne graminicola]
MHPVSKKFVQQDNKLLPLKLSTRPTNSIEEDEKLQCLMQNHHQLCDLDKCMGKRINGLYICQFSNIPGSQYSQYLRHRRRQSAYKTVICKNWLKRSHCSLGNDCRFAHGFDDLRTPTLPLPINDKYKTRLCEKYTSRGICPYGSRCLFIHPEHNELFPSINQTNKKTKNLTSFLHLFFPYDFKSAMRYSQVFIHNSNLICGMILEQLNREKENQQLADPMQLEMERIIFLIFQSPVNIHTLTLLLLTTKF